MKKLVLLPISIAAIILSGCSTTSKTSSEAAPSTPEASSTPAPAKSNPTTLEGSWKGHDTTPGNEGAATLKFTGTTVEFHGATEDDWLKGTFTLRENETPKKWIGVVTDCSSADVIGKKCYAIYTLDGNTLTIGGYRVGIEEFPTTLDDSNIRKFVLKREQ